MLTPGQVHRGEGAAIWAARQETLTIAYATHPERFVRKLPQPPALPEAAWINPPAQPVAAEELGH